MVADAVIWFALFYTANAYFWSPQNFYTVSLTVIQCMYVCWGNGRIKIPCVSWWHGGFADRSVLTGWNQTHRHQDTPEAQTESSSEAVCHGTARLSPLPPCHSNLPGSTPVWACAARHLSTCVTRSRNKTTARTKWDLAISANTSQPEPTNRLAGGGRHSRESVLDNIISVWAWFSDNSENIQFCDTFHREHISLDPRGGNTIPRTWLY